MDCADGYFWDGLNCDACSIINCDECHIESNENGVTWTSCDQCETSNSIIQQFVQIEGVEESQYICDWPGRIANCLESDPDDASICVRCDDHYYFETGDGSCDLCEMAIDGCSMCNEDATECSECLPYWSLTADSTCEFHGCETFVEDSTDCALCTEGFFLTTASDCVPAFECEASSGYADRDNRVCRSLCASNEYYDWSDATNCLACDDVTTFCSSCGPDDGVIAETSTVVCYECTVPL